MEAVETFVVSWEAFFLAWPRIAAATPAWASLFLFVVVAHLCPKSILELAFIWYMSGLATLWSITWYTMVTLSVSSFAEFCEKFNQNNEMKRGIIVVRHLRR